MHLSLHDVPLSNMQIKITSVNAEPEPICILRADLHTIRMTIKVKIKAECMVVLGCKE